jgi:hypothetical protein
VLVEEPLGIVLPDASGIVPLLVNPRRHFSQRAEVKPREEEDMFRHASWAWLRW